VPILICTVPGHHVLDCLSCSFGMAKCREHVQELKMWAEIINVPWLLGSHEIRRDTTCCQMQQLWHVAQAGG
jgi:hypothetical protein